MEARSTWGDAGAPAELVVLPVGTPDAVRAARAAGLYAREAAGWDELGDAAASGPAPAPSVVALELAGLPDAALAGLLDEAARRAPALGARLVVAFAPEQIDAVAGALLGSGAQLLGAPTPADRAAALALARAATAGRVGEPSGADAARLLRLAEDVARIADALAGLALGDDSPERRGDWLAEAADAPPDAAQVRGAIRARRLRDAEFGRGLFEEPAWDMLLDLFAAGIEGAPVSVSSLCLASGVAQTTALRWIERMAAAGLLVRRGDPADRRRVFLTLSARGEAGMRRWFAAVRRAGLTT